MIERNIVAINYLKERTIIMTFVYTAKNVTIRQSFKDYAEKKIGKLEKILQGDVVAHIKLENKKEINRVEVNLKSNDVNIRAEVEDYNATTAIDKAEVILDGQIRKYKTKIEKKMKRKQGIGKNIPPIQGNINDTYEDNDEEDVSDIVRVKKFAMKPMFPEDACLEMELMNHEFYMFFNAESEQVNVVYKRHNGGYGLIEPSFS